jgi:hypothetical protein
MIILKIFGCIILVLLLILILLLFAPVRYFAQGQKYEVSSVSAKAEYMFGVFKLALFKKDTERLQISIKLFGQALKAGSRQKGRIEKAEKIKKGKREHRNICGRLADKGYRSRATIMVNEGFRHICPRKFAINGLFGFDDPFDTAIAWVFLNSLSIWNEGCHITPAFDREMLEGEFIIDGRVVVGKLLWFYAKFRLSKPVRNIYKNERMERKYAH